MKKLALKLEELAVETFTTTPHARSRGTVRGHASEDPALCNTYDGCSDSTCIQILCGCTAGGPDAGTCDAASYCGSCPNQCATDTVCQTCPGYQGC